MVARLSTPYTVFFALACAVSLAAVVTKTRLLVLKLRSRLEGVGPIVTKRRKLTVGGVAIASVVSAVVAGSDSTIVDLKSKFDDLRLQRRLTYCHIASALLEDLPLGKLRRPGLCNLPFAIGCAHQPRRSLQAP